MLSAFKARRCRPFRVLALLLAGAAGWGGAAAAQAEPVRYNRDIKPILSNRCFLCHGPDTKEADFRLDERESATEWVIVPGDADASELIARVTSDDEDTLMPPPQSHKARLSEQEVDLLRRWIDEGAQYESHWAFLPPTRPVAPELNAAGPSSPIDRFVQARLQTVGLSPAPAADRPTLIRRVTLDLTGLPPTPAEIKAFVNDASPEAYEKAVDRLLASPHFGEHQARYWLDLARYADTNGYQYDTDRQQWVWRDWVIQAINTNMPFDRFTIEQMAGDLLPDATDQTRLATGFHRNHGVTIEGGVIDEEYRTEYVMDRVATASTAWMGLTMSCARCHDHKYDPISQKDFYSFYAFFNNVPERGLNGFAPQAKIASPIGSARQAALDSRIAELESQRDRIAAASAKSLPAWERQLQKQNDAWSLVRPTDFRSQRGASLALLDDGSILASGGNPATDVYEITFTAGDAEVGSLRLEALPDESLPAKSVGRAGNGNFVLSEIEVLAGQNGDALRATPIRSATADYEQKGYPAAQAIDGKIDRGGWAVDGDTRIAASALSLSFAQPIPAKSTVRMRLIFHWGGSHTIGRFRLSAGGATSFANPEIAAVLTMAVEQRSAEQRLTLQEFLLQRFGNGEAKTLITELSAARAARDALAGDVPDTMIMAELPQPRPTFVLDRGEYSHPLKDQPVSPAVPAHLGALPEGAPANRLGLAQWLVARDNPLTARVAVNRYWGQMFGTGLVETAEDFGSQGEYPSHPELLDWLAVEFMEAGWDVKHILKTIVMSDVYQQSSYASPEAYNADPKNRLLARGPRFRLEAETIRDSAMLVSGLLNDELGGPSVFPYHPPGLWLEINNRPGYSKAYPHTTEPAHLYRRSLYTFWKRTVPPPSLATFDAPEREYCVVQRSRTNTPLQAFVMLHDPQFVEAARKLAERMILDGGAALPAKLSHGFELCTGRQPSAAELAVLTKTYKERLAQYRRDRRAAEKVLAAGQSPRAPEIDTAELAAMTSAARLLLNLSEFLTKG